MTTTQTDRVPFTVTVRSQFPACGEQPSTYDVMARDKAHAVKLAKWMAEKEGMMNLGQGRITFKATRDE